MFLKQIELFVAAAKDENLGKTAERMHVSASSVCQRLRSVENELGVKLYKRTRKGIELTGPGQTLLSTASEVLDRLESLKKSLSGDSELTVESLGIGGTFNPAGKYLPPAIAEFQKTHPNVKLTFASGDRRSMEKLLRQGDIEIALIQTPSQSSDFHLEHFAEDSLVFFAHPAYPPAKKKTFDLKELSERPLIVRAGRGTTHKTLRSFTSRGLMKNVILRCTSPAAVKTAVLKRMGAGVLFFSHIEREVARNELKLLNFVGLPELVGHSYIAYCKNKPLSRAASDFLDVLRSMKPGATALRRPRKSNERTGLSANEC
jgi:DNA-binding transcriptional LysR family regulator